jgi:hypothetical protein
VQAPFRKHRLFDYLFSCISRYHPGSRPQASTSLRNGFQPGNNPCIRLTGDKPGVPTSYLVNIPEAFRLRLRKDFQPAILPRLAPFPGSLPVLAGLLVSIIAFNVSQLGQDYAIIVVKGQLNLVIENQFSNFVTIMGFNTTTIVNRRMVFKNRKS